MCEFCEAGEPIKAHGKKCDTSARIVWDKGKWRLVFEAESYGVLAWMRLGANYCPICGRRLDGRDER